VRLDVVHVDRIWAHVGMYHVMREQKRELSDDAAHSYTRRDRLACFGIRPSSTRRELLSWPGSELPNPSLSRTGKACATL